MRRILWLACLLSSPLLAQGPPFSEWPAPLREHFGVAGEILDHAIRYRAVPIQKININVGWGITILNAGEDGSSTTFIVTYKPPDQAPFHVQAIVCDDDTKHAHLYDATVLGATETAEEFYKDNTVFFTPDLKSSLIKCFSEALIMGEISYGESNDPNVRSISSPDRAIRHLCYWARFFRGRDKKRAADFMVAALDDEKTLLQEMEVKQEYKLLSGNLDLFDKRLPRENLDPALPLDQAQRADVRAWLETTIRIRRKLKLFLPDAGPRIASDEALLARFR